jgi:hypothetical protein
MSWNNPNLAHAGLGLVLAGLIVILPGTVVGQVQSGDSVTKPADGFPGLQPPPFAWLPPAPLLPLPTQSVVRVSNVRELLAAAAGARSGDAILLADGHYLLPRCLHLRTDRLTLRGESGKRERVVLDGSQCRDGELVALHACSDVTIADLTVQNVRHNGIKINSDSNVQRVTIRNCILHNIWQRAVKGVKVPAADRANQQPKDCRIEYCLFYNDRPKQFSDDEADTARNFDGNYVGGIDVMYARGWVIRDNVFLGIQGRTRAARGAIFLWHETEDCLVERNVIVDCDTGIALGNSHKPADVATHATRCVVRNNFLTRTPEGGIVADYTVDCQIVHNTVHDPTNRYGRLIRLVHDNHGLVVAGNLLSGPSLRNEATGRMILEQNPSLDLTATFADPHAGDLHLQRGLPDSLRKKIAGTLPASHGVIVQEDFDRKPRPLPPTPGADEP